jgi:hypothetical protein
MCCCNALLLNVLLLNVLLLHYAAAVMCCYLQENQP